MNQLVAGLCLVVSAVPVVGQVPPRNVAFDALIMRDSAVFFMPVAPSLLAGSTRAERVQRATIRAFTWYVAWDSVSPPAGAMGLGCCGILASVRDNPPSPFEGRALVEHATGSWFNTVPHNPNGAMSQLAPHFTDAIVSHYDAGYVRLVLGPSAILDQLHRLHPPLLQLRAALFAVDTVYEALVEPLYTP